jgi:flagella basal body P-ring formation protein FlgA
MIRESCMNMVGIIVWTICGLLGEALAAAPNPDMARVDIKPQSVCPSNIVYLKDVATLSGSVALVERLSSLQIAPAPLDGQSHRWSKQEIARLIWQRGFNAGSIHMAGAESCEVTRRSKDLDIEPVAFTPTQSHSANPIQAQRHIVQAIRSYLQTKSNQNVVRNIEVQLPDRHIKTLSHSRAILGVAGGEPPYEGQQTFVFLVKTPQGEESVTIQAQLQSPATVVVAKGPLRRGQVIREDDLTTGSLPLNAKLDETDCFQNVRDLIGKETRRAISSGQPFARTDIGPERVLDVQDLVQVEILSGGIQVQTTAKCVQSGGIGELIQVELIPHRKRVVAEIVSPRLVRIVKGE